ncbi:response regulator [Celerinatantimonas diazotrophica]|uniref:Two-component system chemotaxis response regulator CheY n=1 Tax=Celerinatantimonas diazotrophica TaxID=412034 RepID=A0A4R1JAI2_9GAMM|nr:response regulator [Celerinatantimonas diazotrophica]TCK47653.1 two-component system chemotaxis response regulator CheY [Celerinatantimonas diazotrophica]CAG9296724.1 Chemotaxis protein CheY [Celerinatantimonas diazotrophica]
MKNLKVLVVDDFSTMRRIIKNILKDLGIEQIEMAEDGVHALSMVQHTQFDLIITDWNMPNMNGLELLKAIRKTKSIDELPVLMVTAETKREQIVEAAKAGVNGYIVKPFSQVTLDKKIKFIFRKIYERKCA